ncbi:hypothetical protein EVA_10401 [gut metagenome]|uniref:Uncharacterized protein n=1 Tax=gut metagenome TaxID=749906 RepID=J9G3S5_9ZZZZ
MCIFQHVVSISYIQVIECAVVIHKTFGSFGCICPRNA